MIKNEKQYRSTQSQADLLARELAEVEEAIASGSSQDARIHELEAASLGGMLAELRAELEEYEALSTQRVRVLELSALEDLPRVLIQARIAGQVTHKELAARLGIAEQQVQRYEASDYEAVSFKRMVDVARALGVHVREDVVLPSADLSFASFKSALKKIGFDPEWILTRVLPRSLVAALTDPEPAAEPKTGSDTSAGLVVLAGSYLQRVFGVPLRELFEGGPQLQFAGGAPRFKVPARARPERLVPFTAYAYHLARLALRATEHLPRHPVPADPMAVRATLLERDGALTLEGSLRYVWSLGIPVLPLHGIGGFHAACWREDGRNVVVLKQTTASPDRWISDLFHEVGHAGERPEEPTFAAIDAEDPVERRDSPEEQRAIQYGALVVLGEDADKLFAQCWRSAFEDPQKLKGVVGTVAKKANVPTGALANSLAHWLQETHGIDWWGAATNRQTKGVDPWQIARDIFLENAHLGALEEMDRVLLVQALSGPVES